MASDAGGSAKGKAVAIPEGQITAASIDEQYELADLVRSWTDKKKDWRLFTAIDDDDEEIGTKCCCWCFANTWRSDQHR